MLYSLSEEEQRKIKNSPFLPDFKNAEMLFAVFETEAGIVKSILPSPLVPSNDNTASAFVARYPETNFGCVYNEGALFINCEYKGERGTYCLSMPVDDDMALIGGRETYGYPKKIADSITLESHGDNVIGSVVRKKKEILRIECQLSGNAPEDFFSKQGYQTEDWDGVPCIKMVSFLFKYFQSPGGRSFDYLPRLIREPVLFRPQEQLRMGTGTVKLGSTAFDPLAEITVKEVKDMIYGIFHNTMLPGKVVARVWNPLRFMKHAFFKADFIPTLLEQYDPTTLERQKEIVKKSRSY
jgi:acetoacetate decarboxylase